MLLPENRETATSGINESFVFQLHYWDETFM